MLLLPEHFTNQLLLEPESGMGFQLVKVRSKAADWMSGIVYNADLFLENTQRWSRGIGANYKQLLFDARNSRDEILQIQTIRPAAVREMASNTKGQEAKDAPVTPTRAGDTFIRFSAYENDRRVTSDRRLLPGTYATTEADASNVLTGRDAVERYALPNPEPASHRFESKPHVNTAVQRGVVAPANGHRGGGIEVIFPNGTQPYTTLRLSKIPD